MLFQVLTLFPGLFDAFFKQSIIGRALENKAFKVRITDIRDFTFDSHRTVDDRPFGGGPGMVLKPEPVAAAIESALAFASEGQRRVILLAPAGRPLTQPWVRELSTLDHLILVCGRYEGIDERISLTLIDEEMSVGDYVLSGGEVPAMAVIEAVSRLLPNVVGKAESVEEETFSAGLLEYPHYTRPRIFRNLAVPEVLLSGDHAAIHAWRLKESLRRTLKRRPALLEQAVLTPEARKILGELRKEMEQKKMENILDFSGQED